MIEIRKVSVQETYEIRKGILRENIPLTEKMDGVFDSDTIHLGVFKDKELTCIATFMQHDNDHFKGSQYRLRGMATHKDFQHQGLGKKIIEEAERILLEMDVEVLWCNARVLAVQFYEKCGFKVEGSDFDIRLIGQHFVMYKKLEK